MKEEALKGVKIAIDAGHFGGQYAFLEERCTVIPQKEKDVVFDEGTLTMLTALYLKELLENQGATIYLTRKGIGQGAISENFHEWFAKNKEQIEVENPLSKTFRRYYNLLDLKERAEKINAFSPDFTIIIHYNSDDSAASGGISKRNFNMAFIPLTYTNESVLLSKLVTEEFTKHLLVRTVEEADDLSYIKKHCQKVCDGVYTRELCLTRLVTSPLCYGESLVLNNEEEWQRMTTFDTEIQGIKCSSRLKQVATAYFCAIMKYVQMNPKPHIQPEF